MIRAGDYIVHCTDVNTIPGKPCVVFLRGQEEERVSQVLYQQSMNGAIHVPDEFRDMARVVGITHGLTIEDNVNPGRMLNKFFNPIPKIQALQAIRFVST